MCLIRFPYFRSLVLRLYAGATMHMLDAVGWEVVDRLAGEEMGMRAQV